MIGETKLCGQCNNLVQVVNEVFTDGQFEQVLSCGHSRKDSIRSLFETTPISGELISAGSGFKTLNIEPSTTGTIPVNVSGEAVSGQVLPKTQGLLDLSTLNMHKEGNVIVANNITIYTNSPHTQTHIESSTTVNNLNDVMSLVENSNYSQEEKSKIKEILTIVDKEKDKKPITEIISSSLKDYKPYFDIARDFISMLVIFFK